MSQLPTSPDLGTLSNLPLELRERIYSLVLNLDAYPPRNPSSYNHHPNCTCSPPQPPPNQPPKLSLLLVSRTIHLESRIILFRENEWNIEVHDDIEGSRLKTSPNTSIMGRAGWKMTFSHVNWGRFTKDQTEALDRDNIWGELRYVHVSVGSRGSGVREYDILPWKRQTRQGPERPSFVEVRTVMRNVCELLKGCRQLHCLRVTLRSIEKKPGNMEMLIEPLRELRGVKRTMVVCMGMQDDRWVDWNLKGSYGRYLNKIMGMPEGAKAPRYVGDEKEPNQNDKEIFDMIGATWCGGQTFAYPNSDEDDEDGFDFEDEEMAEFGEFLEYMGIPEHIAFGGFGLGGWETEEEDDEDDEDDDEGEEDDDDDYSDEDDYDDEDVSSEEPFDSSEDEDFDGMLGLIPFSLGTTLRQLQEQLDAGDHNQDDEEEDFEDMPDFVSATAASEPARYDQLMPEEID